MSCNRWDFNSANCCFEVIDEVIDAFAWAVIAHDLYVRRIPAV